MKYRLTWSNGISCGRKNVVWRVSSPGLKVNGATSLALQTHRERPSITSRHDVTLATVIRTGMLVLPCLQCCNTFLLLQKLLILHLNKQSSKFPKLRLRIELQDVTMATQAGPDVTGRGAEDRCGHCVRQRKLPNRECQGREQALCQEALSAWYHAHCHCRHLCLLQLLLVVHCYCNVSQSPASYFHDSAACIPLCLRQRLTGDAQYALTG